MALTCTCAACNPYEEVDLDSRAINEYPYQGYPEKKFLK